MLRDDPSKLAALFEMTAKVIDASTDGTEICPRDPLRVGLYLYGSSTQCAILPDIHFTNQVPGNGFFFGADGYRAWTFADHGPLVQQRWVVSLGALGVFMTVVELRYRPQLAGKE